MIEYLFLRHAEAGHHASDHERPLTALGEQQAAKCNLSSFPCDLILTSSAKRAIQTATLIRQNNFPHAPLEHVKQLYLPQKNSDIQSVLKLLQETKDQNLNQLLAKDREGAWKRYRQEAYDALKAAVEKHHPRHVLIIAHANIINDLGLQIAPEATELRALYFAPCTGFRLNSDLSLDYIF